MPLGDFGGYDGNVPGDFTPNSPQFIEAVAVHRAKAMTSIARVSRGGTVWWEVYDRHTLTTFNDEASARASFTQIKKDIAANVVFGRL
jgi:hypothetical protein